MRTAIALLLVAGSGLGQEIPSWLTLGGSYRGRGEFTQATGFEQNDNENYYLSRLRVHADVVPRPGLEFYVEAQDARVAGLSESESDGLLDHFDFRQAWVRLGTEKTKWRLQVGRQELAFGDERLVGADNQLDPLGFSWDAAQLTYSKGDLQIRSFGAVKVSVTPRAMDQPDRNERLYGVYLTLPKFRKVQLEPYFFFNQQLWHCSGEDGALVFNHIGVIGFRSAGNITHKLDYNIEMAAEGGQFNNQTMRSWAGHWEGGWRFGAGDNAPRLRAEYNQATGDRHQDKVHSTFDDLYPAGYNAYGMADPFAWRNIRNPSLRMEVPLKKNWTLLGGYRWYALDTVQDGLYVVGEECLTRNPAAKSADVGQQLSLGAAWQPSSHWNVNAGYSRFFSGPYLTESGFHSRMSSPYVSATFLF